jgi:N-glycosylase/DNA lyase
MIKWRVEGHDIIIYNLADFDPVHTFECGQCFRWNRKQNGRWFGVAKGLFLELSWDGHNLILHDTTIEEFKKVWYTYFDFERDYSEIKRKLSENDPVMADAVEFGRGIRLLKQDFYEAAVSFLISQNNGIPRIKKIIESLSSAFGEPVANRFNSEASYKAFSFPSMERIAGLSPEDLKIIRAGYRDKYILRTSRQILDNEIDMNILKNKNRSESRREMLKLYGVGRKVADCILLFSGTRYDIFPVDRWVKRVMAKLYLGYEAGFDELDDFAQKKFGNLAGFAQQYLFYYARAKKVGV